MIVGRGRKVRNPGERIVVHSCWRTLRLAPKVLAVRNLLTFTGMLNRDRLGRREDGYP